MGEIIRLHLMPDYDRALLPVPAARLRGWWEQDGKTCNHARHCQPLMMANSLGYYLLSPGRFAVAWDGDPDHDAAVEVHDAASHCEVTTHSAHGSFTVQAKFLPRTQDPGDFVWVKGIPNERTHPFTCMEALIEAWWNPAHFGLVFLLHRAGAFTVERGQPIAQMLLYNGRAGEARLEVDDGLPEEHH